MDGVHLTADLHRCRCVPERLTDAAALLAHCVTRVQAAGLRVVGQLAHPFTGHDGRPAGVTATVLLAESHLCVHTWPEHAAVTLDVYVCNVGADHRHQAQALLDELIAWFAPEQAQRQRLLRGAIAPPVAPPGGRA